jgi:hypothetical protein
MSTRILVAGLMSLALTASAPRVPTSTAMWPAWLAIESPVNPYDPTTRGDVLLVHATMREGGAQLADITGTAEGIVDGKRQSIQLHFDGTSRPDVFGVRRQWPTEGSWVLRIAFRQTIALVALDQTGNVASSRVPTEAANGQVLPRPVASREIDSTLAALAKR